MIGVQHFLRSSYLFLAVLLARTPVELTGKMLKINAPTFSKSCSCLIFGSGLFVSSKLLTVIFDEIKICPATIGLSSVLLLDSTGVFSDAERESTEDISTNWLLLVAFSFLFFVSSRCLITRHSGELYQDYLER